jgi:hypothetical protein
VKAIDPAANTQSLNPPKVGWLWPAIDSQCVIDVLIRRCFNLTLFRAICALIFSIVIFTDTRKWFSEFSRASSWILIGTAIYVLNLFYLRRHSPLAVFALVTASTINLMTLVFDTTLEERLLGFFSVAIQLLLTMIDVNAMRAIFAYHNASRRMQDAPLRDQI